MAVPIGCPQISHLTDLTIRQEGQEDMLYTSKVAEALEKKRERLTHRESAFARDLHAYRDILSELSKRYPQAAMLDDVLDAAHGATGARPLPIYDQWAGDHLYNDVPSVPFGQQFANHAEARAWAETIVAGTTTIAVDGSQIMPWHDASIPIALVQAGIFANPHDARQPYYKDVFVEILSPDDLAPDPDEQDEDEILRLASEEIVHLRRFALETRILARWMRSWKAQPGQPAPVAFLDGSLIVSFALTMPPALRKAYVAAVTDVLTASEESKVPLVAYIDTSHARDMTTLLRAAFPERGLAETKRINDALLWQEALGWGDYTLPFLSARGDVLEEYKAQRGSIAFTYLRAALDRPPSRIEIPRWVAEGSEFTRVIDVVRAEVIAGNGYPYAIETADAVAVISAADRARFFGLFQRFADDTGLNLRFSHKALSKSHRRM
jgi:NurA domain